MKLTPDDLIQELSVVVDASFARSAVESYVEMEQRFLAGDWKPAELDGGRLCEAVSRAVLQLDAGKVDHHATPGDVRNALRNTNLQHNLSAQDHKHISKVIDAVYEMRSSRGVVHISPMYSANFMDSMFVIHASKWVLAEFLRLAWKKDRTTVASVIEQLVQMEQSLIHEIDGKPFVLIKDITAVDEILLLLNHASGNRLSRSRLIEYTPNQKPNTIRSAVTTLVNRKDVANANDGDVILTPNGQKRTRETLIPKYLSRS